MGSKIPSAIGDAPRLKAIPSEEQLNFRGRKISIQPIADTLIGVPPANHLRPSRYGNAIPISFATA